MGKIRLLPDDLANQIAAGEVVERPASVVKELIENAIDAGAGRVRVDVEGGGLGLIRVSDDGAGMDREDAELALHRHATSKITTLQDLAVIRSYGFRGEALPSIASVSRFTLRTRRTEDDTAVEVTVEGGGPSVTRPCGAATGTTIEVRDLFFNVPARRKFLRSPATETAHVTEVTEAAALASFERTFVLAREGRVAREWLRAEDREERVRLAFGEEPLSRCAGERGPLRVEAFLGRPERARAAAASLRLFVNGRPVRDRALARAVAQAYGSVLEPGRYPLGVVFLELEPALVDVNVHPQKAEVRFADGRAVGEALFRTLADELARAFGMPVAKRTWGPPKPEASRAPPPSHEGAPSFACPPSSRATSLPASLDPPVPPWVFSAADDATVEPVTDAAPPPRPYPLFDRGPPDERPAFSRLAFIAQVRQTYLLCQGEAGLFVLDQHAAAERVTFHRLRRAYDGRDVATQTLLFPVRVEVTAGDVAFVEEEQPALSALGLDVRAIGATTVAVHAMPRLLSRATPEDVVRDLISEATRSGGRAFSNAIDLALATMACHGSVRAGDRLLPEEATALLVALDEVDFSGHCPHGRPILTRIGWDELERKVGRR